MFEIMYPFACVVRHLNVDHPLAAEKPLRVERKDLNLFYGSAGLNVRALDKDGNPMAPWFNGADAIEKAIAIAEGEQE